MGLFTLAIPGILFGEHLRRRTQDREYDPEKAVRHDSRSSDDLDGHDFDENHDRSSHDVLSSNTPHRRIRHVYSNAKPPAFDGPVNSTASDSDDVSRPTPSWWQRVKDYIWPSDEQLAELDSFVPNYRWTPILSGIIIPFSILLEIPGLTEKWYIKTEGTQIVAVQSNPMILEVGLAISMASAVIANVALIFRFLEKRVKTVTLLCIAFLTLHGMSYTCVSSFIAHRSLCRYHQYHRSYHLRCRAPFRRWLHIWRSFLDDTLLDYRVFDNERLHHRRLCAHSGLR